LPRRGINPGKTVPNDRMVLRRANAKFDRPKPAMAVRRVDRARGNDRRAHEMAIDLPLKADVRLAKGKKVVPHSARVVRVPRSGKMALGRRVKGTKVDVLPSGKMVRPHRTS
jgi:hypothetical protein